VVSVVLMAVNVKIFGDVIPYIFIHASEEHDVPPSEWKIKSGAGS
jgi:hypothetical protein